MKSQSAATIAIVAELAAVTQSRKDLEAREKNLKLIIRAKMGDSSALTAGTYVVTRTSRNRRDLDRDAIAHDMGSEFMEKYTKLSSYEIMEVKKSKLVKEA